MPNRSPVFVHLLPALIPPDALEGGIAVVIDVLRATSTMVAALANGAEAIAPCVEIDEARRLASSLPRGSGLLVGERQGVMVEGFDLPNSPLAVTPAVCSGKTLVMTTTNGTRALQASLGAERILVAAFNNRKATLDALRSDHRPVHLVCSGTDGLVSLEDTLFAGSLAQAIDTSRRDGRGRRDEPMTDDPDLPSDTAFGNDAAEIAAGLWREAELTMDEGFPLADILGDGRGGQRVRALGAEADLAEAARLDLFPIVAEYDAEARRITVAGGPRLRLFGAT